MPWRTPLARPRLMTISPLPIIFATLPSTAMRYDSLCCSLPKNYARIISLANAPSRASYNPSLDRKSDSGTERAHEPGGEAPADLGRPQEYAPPGARAGTGSGPDLRLQPPRVGKSSHKSAHAYDDGRKVKAK